MGATFSALAHYLEDTMSTQLPAALTAPTTQPHGALSPTLAAKLDELSDQGRVDRLLSEHDINPAEVVALSTSPLQLELFDYNDAGDAVGYNGASL